MGVEQYYVGTAGEAYFRHREHCRDPRAQLEGARLLQPYVRPDDVVVDFGCGTGGLLAALPCARRIGVEISEPARREAEANGLDTYSRLEDVPDEVADLVISHHVFEHLAEPLATLRALRRVLKPGGRLVLVVPLENGHRPRLRRWRPNMEHHLFCWTPVALGNLVRAANYELDDAFVRPGGYSRYIEWLRPVGPAFAVAKLVVARVMDRYHVVAVGRRG